MELLEQALRSGDEQIISFILKKNTEDQIKESVSKLKAPLLVILVKSLTKYIEERADNLGLVLPWLEAAVDIRQSDLAASADCQRRLRELANILRQRTYSISLFTEAKSMSELISNEKNGPGVGLPVYEDYAQVMEE